MVECGFRALLGRELRDLVGPQLVRIVTRGTVSGLGIIEKVFSANVLAGSTGVKKSLLTKAKPCRAIHPIQSLIFDSYRPEFVVAAAIVTR